MAKQLQLRRGTTQANDLFTGANGEVSVDTTTHGLRVHDGSTQGGYLVDTVVAFQRPSIDNNYTWYRKYASGWVEQGCNGGQSGTITLAVEMADANYFVSTRPYGGSNNVGWGEYGSNLNRTTTTFTAGTLACIWEVKGMAA